MMMMMMKGKKAADLPQRAARCWWRGRVHPTLCTSPRPSDLSSWWSAVLSADLSAGVDCSCPPSSTGPTTLSCSWMETWPQCIKLWWWMMEHPWESPAPSFFFFSFLQNPRNPVIKASVLSAEVTGWVTTSPAASQFDMSTVCCGLLSFKTLCKRRKLISKCVGTETRGGEVKDKEMTMRCLMQNNDSLALENDPQGLWCVEIQDQVSTRSKRLTGFMVWEGNRRG